MAELIAIYKKPADPAAFDAYYAGTHTPLALKMPGLRKLAVSSGPVAGPAELPYLVAILTFDSLAAIQAALESPEGVATAGDLAHFAQAGVELIMFDTRTV